MGIKEAAVSDARSILIRFFPCPMPNAQCPMPDAQCPMPYYLIPILFFFFAATFVNLPKVVNLAGFLIKFRFRQTPLLQGFI